jgi:hypothetical protein
MLIDAVSPVRMTNVKNIVCENMGWNITAVILSPLKFLVSVHRTNFLFISSFLVEIFESAKSQYFKRSQKAHVGHWHYFRYWVLSLLSVLSNGKNIHIGQ